jgi:hypothetical protein
VLVLEPVGVQMPPREDLPPAEEPARKAVKPAKPGKAAQR